MSTILMIFGREGKRMQRLMLAFGLFAMLFFSGCATVHNPDPNDPWESYNRTMFEFNDTVDRYTLKPVAQAYDYVMPEFAEQRVSNFFSNLDDLGNFVHGILQLDFETAFQDLTRFIFNTTLGLGGLFEVTEDLGFLTPKHQQDMGVTLASWGVPQGPYVVLPLLGPATVRSAVGKVPDYFISPGYVIGAHTQWLGENDTEIGYGVTALDIIQTRAELLDLEELLIGDRYTAVRDAYLNRRTFIITGEQPVSESDPFLDEASEDEGWDDEW